MTGRAARAVLAWAALAGAGAVPASESPPSDIATTHAGDVHSGWIRQQTISVRTEFATLTLPLWMVKSVRFDIGDGMDRVDTSDGGYVHGEVVDGDLTVSRVLGAPLTVHTSDLAVLRVGPRPRTDGAAAPDLIELQTGDLLRAHLLAGPANILPAAAVEPNKSIRVDVDEREGELHTRVWSPSGTRLHSQPKVTSLAVQWPGGDVTELPLESIRTLAFGIPEGTDLTDFLLGPEDGWSFRDTLVDGTRGPLMATIPDGSYLRGPTGEQGDDNEKPVRNVTIEAPFAIGVHEVTFDEYAAFCRDTGLAQPDDSGWGRGRRPVINVSWEEAVAYAAWLSRKSGHRYRLPTEAEWEFAARAQTETPYWWGAGVREDMANCTGCGSLWDGEKTAPVGTFRGNGFKIHDTVGNVWEWVADCYQDTYEGVPDDGSAYEQTPCGKRVTRGGAWSFPAAEARAASRWRDFPTRRSDDTGFRLVRELTSAEASALASR